MTFVEYAIFVMALMSVFLLVLYLASQWNRLARWYNESKEKQINTGECARELADRLNMSVAEVWRLAEKEAASRRGVSEDPAVVIRFWHAKRSVENSLTKKERSRRG